MCEVNRQRDKSMKIPIVAKAADRMAEKEYVGT